MYPMSRRNWTFRVGTSSDEYHVAACKDDHTKPDHQQQYSGRTFTGVESVGQEVLFHGVCRRVCQKLLCQESQPLLMKSFVRMWLCVARCDL